MFCVNELFVFGLQITANVIANDVIIHQLIAFPATVYIYPSTGDLACILSNDFS